MKKTGEKPIYNISYAELMQLGDNVVKLINRDKEVLAVFGIDDEVKQTIVNLTKELKEIQTDEELEGKISEQTEIKDKAAELVRMSIRNIMVRVKNTYGENSAKFRSFGTTGMNELSDAELYKCGQRVARVARENLNELAPKGLTLEIINDFIKINQSFDDKIDFKKDAIKERDIATETRIKLANNLYTKVVEVCDFGKQHWESKDESKYNDYVIYEKVTDKTEQEVVSEENK